MEAGRRINQISGRAIPPCGWNSPKLCEINVAGFLESVSEYAHFAKMATSGLMKRIVFPLNKPWRKLWRP